MAKRGEDNVSPEGDGVAETAPIAKSVSVSSILTEDDAKQFVKNYPELKGEVFVTTDLNVFEDIKFARNHASKQGLKIFTIQCQD